MCMKYYFCIKKYKGDTMVIAKKVSDQNNAKISNLLKFTITLHLFKVLFQYICRKCHIVTKLEAIVR